MAGILSAVPTVFVEGGSVSFPADPRMPVLDSALANGVRLPHNCRSGICGTCKATVLEGALDDSDGEDFALTDLEHSRGVRLLCQALPASDVIRVRVHLPLPVQAKGGSGGEGPPRRGGVREPPGRGGSG